MSHLIFDLIEGDENHLERKAYSDFVLVVVRDTGTGSASKDCSN